MDGPVRSGSRLKYLERIRGLFVPVVAAPTHVSEEHATGWVTKRLTLDDYRALLPRRPAPSSEQMEAFARFVSTAHSWYKHLSPLPPGVPMVFYLDPDAGTQRVVDRRGRVSQVKRRKQGFHYSWLPTVEYRSRFGYAAFAAAAGTTVSLILADGSEKVPSDKEPLIFDPRAGQFAALPHEVLAAGTADVSALIHPRAAWPAVWHRFRSDRDDRSVFNWSTEVEAALYGQILERIEALRDGAPVEEIQRDAVDDGDRGYVSGCDLVLYRLLVPERERQKRRIVAALQHVVDLTR